MNLPNYIQRLIKEERIEDALEHAESDDERIEISARSDSHDTENVAQEILFTSTVSDIEVNRTTATVYCGDFVGHHPIRTDRHNEPNVITRGSYIHEPTGFEFGAECPDEMELHDTVRKVSNTESPEAAATEAYRRSRL